MNKRRMATPLTIRKRIALELWAMYEGIVRKEHPLKQLFWECTLRCNLHCKHCGSDCSQNDTIKDMPMEDFLCVLDSIAKKIAPHNVFVILSGGEPLMRKDLEICCSSINAKGFPWGMVTNGYLLTRNRLENLLHSGLQSITVSLDGLEKEHNWLRGNVHSFHNVDNAISMLVSVPNLTFGVVTCVHRGNIGKLHEIKEYLISKQVRKWRIFSVFPAGRAKSNPEMQLTGEEFRQIFDFIVETNKEGSIKTRYGCEGFLGNYEGEVRDHFFTCQAGVTVASVLVNGDIAGCTSIRANYSQGNIYKDDFMDVWEKQYKVYREREWMRTGICARCEYFRYCRGNGMHLRDSQGNLLLCHLKKLISE